MEKRVLDNGLTVLTDSRESDSVAIVVSARVGSNNEPNGLEGISHFLEHMMFEGTRKRRDSRAIANEIEKLGGDLNAATSNDRTFYYVKIPRKHFTVGLDILSDMMKNPVFPERGIANNRKVILNEIHMVDDEPSFYQWVLFYKELFKGTPVGKPVYGRVDSVKNMDRGDLLEYYRAHYTPKNMLLSIVGGVSEKEIRKAGEYFTLKKSGLKYNALNVPNVNKKSEVVERKDINQSYLVLGYRTVPRLHEDSYTLDVIRAVLGRGQSGWMFDEIRNKRALAYNVSVNHHPELDYGLFAVNVGTKKANVKKVVGLISQTFSRLRKLSPAQLQEAKTYLEGNRILDFEDNLHRADSMCFFEHAGDYTAAASYLREINAVTLADVKRVVDRYLTEDYTLTVLEQGK